MRRVLCKQNSYLFLVRQTRLTKIQKGVCAWSEIRKIILQVSMPAILSALTWTMIFTMCRTQIVVKQVEKTACLVIGRACAIIPIMTAVKVATTATMRRVMMTILMIMMIMMKMIVFYKMQTFVIDKTITSCPSTCNSCTTRRKALAQAVRLPPMNWR